MIITTKVWGIYGTSKVVKIIGFLPAGALAAKGQGCAFAPAGLGAGKRNLAAVFLVRQLQHQLQGFCIAPGNQRGGGAGGMGGKTGLYLVGFNRKDGIVGKRDTAIPLNASDFRGINRNQTQNAVLVDLCSGHPKQTDAARCLTARYGQTTLSNRKGERSGVLLIKEATKKGYKEAQPGDTVDLGYAGSNTRRGRVGCDIAHTLETSCIQGIVENGGRIRRLMPRECLRLQGFEEWQIDRILAIQSDAQAYKQAGNSVTVNVIEAIAKRIQAVDEELKTGAAA